MTHGPLTELQIREFHTNGMLVVRGFYDLASEVVPVQRGIQGVIGQVLTAHGIEDRRGAFAPEQFDAQFQELIATDRKFGGEVYDAVKQIPAFLRLVAHPAHEAVFAQLRSDSFPGIAAGGYGIRIDNPNEDKYRAYWHQEYPAQLRSQDGLVFWSPLVPLTDQIGPVQFCPGSHREGPLAVLAQDTEGAGRSGAYALKLSGEEAILARYAKIAPLCDPGDLVLIDFFTVHASGYNRSRRSRWSMQFRYFNFAEPIGRSYAWRGSFAAGVDFAQIHPELIVAAGGPSP